MTGAAEVPIGEREKRPVQSKTYFDRDGDLTLVVGPDGSECVVCPRALARGSPVFKSMLFGGFSESKPSEGEWIVKLPEDDPEAFILLLHILHGQYHKVPGGLSEERLYEVTVLADKYDLTSSLRPWTKCWLDYLKDIDRAAENQAMRIWIAWELGDLELFRSELRWHLLNCKATLFRHDERQTPYFKTLDDVGLIGMIQRFTVTSSSPSNGFLADALKKTRIQMIRSLLDPVTRLHDRLLGIRYQTPFSCNGRIKLDTHLIESSACSGALLISLLKALHAVKLYPIPQPYRYKDDITTLCRLLQTAASSIISLETEPSRLAYRYTGTSLVSDHSSCNPRDTLISELQRMYDAAPDLVDQTHEDHLKAQAEKTRMPSN